MRIQNPQNNVYTSQGSVLGITSTATTQDYVYPSVSKKETPKTGMLTTDFKGTESRTNSMGSNTFSEKQTAPEPIPVIRERSRQATAKKRKGLLVIDFNADHIADA